MAVAFTEKLAAWDASNVTSNPATYSTATLTATANRLYVIFVWGTYVSGSAPETVTCAGGGLGSWTEILTGTQTGGDIEIRYAAFRATSASPGAGAAVTFTFGNNDMIGCGWVCYEITGHNTTTPVGTTNVATAGSGTGATPTLASATSGSGIVAGSYHQANEATTVEAGWTEGTDVAGNNPASGITSGTRTNTSDLSCAFTWSSDVEHAAIAIEIKSGGTAYTQAVSGAIDNTKLIGALVKRGNKALSGSINNTKVTGALARRTNKTIAGTVSSMAGTLSRRTSKLFSGTVSSIVGTLVYGRIFYRSVSGAVSTITGSVVRRTSKAFAAAITPSGTLIRGTYVYISGVVSSIVGTVVRTTKKPLTGTVTIGGSLIRKTLKVLAGAITPVGHLLKKLNPLRILVGFKGWATKIGISTTKSATIVKQDKESKVGISE